MKINYDILKLVLLMISRGHFQILFREIKRRIYSTSCSILWRRDMSIPFKGPRAKIDFTLRVATDEDIKKLLNFEESNITPEDALDRIRRYLMVKSNIKECYVGVTKNNDLCHLHWLIDASQNEKLEAYFKKGTLPLDKDDIMLEGGYTPAKYRNLGVMSCAMSMLSEMTATWGKREVFGYVKQKNDASLKAMEKAGFVPHKEKRETWMFFRRRLKFSCVQKNNNREE